MIIQRYITNGFNPKQLTALDALNDIIPFVPIENRDLHKATFVANFFLLWYKLKKEKKNIDVLDTYKGKCKKYLNDIIKSKKISKKIKLKMVLIYYMPHTYYLIKNIKNRMEKK